MYLATDRPHALRQAISACRKGGTVSIPGVYGGWLDKFPLGAAFAKGLTLKMGQTHMHSYMPALLERIERGEIDPSFIITHRVTLDDAPEMYRTFREKDDGCIKVVMRPGERNTREYPRVQHPTTKEIGPWLKQEHCTTLSSTNCATPTTPKAADQGAAEAGQGRDARRSCETPSSRISRRRVDRSIAWSRCSKPWTRRRAANTARALPASSRKASRSWKRTSTTTTMDACLIAAGQRAEHYEMAAYGTLVAWARAMGHTEAADLLQETLDEEKAADEKLSSLAEGGINQRAAEAANSEESDADEEEDEDENAVGAAAKRGASKGRTIRR